MGKQEDFVLRALEERDVRFVRLWFTDVLGYLKSVAIAPAELEGAFSEGSGLPGTPGGGVLGGNWFRRLGDRGVCAGLRGPPAPQAGPIDVPDPAVAGR